MKETSSTARAHVEVARPAASDHLVQFYVDDRHLSEAVAQFLRGGLEGTDQLLVIATEAHRTRFRDQLELLGVDVGAALEEGRLTLLDAEQTLARLMREGTPDARLFEAEIGRLVAHQTKSLTGPSRLRAYGEMVDLLWSRGERDAAIRLEELWNELQQRHSFTLLCAYAMANFYKEPTALQDVSGLHDHVSEATPFPNLALKLAQESAQRAEVEQALRQSLRELRKSQHQLQQITDTLPTLVTFVDTEHRYRFMNAAYERWFGHPRAEVLGKHLKDVLGAEAYEAVRPHVERALTGTTASYEAQLPYREGGSRWVEATYIPQREGDEITGFIGLVSDIGERKRREAASTLVVDRADRLLKITSAIADAVTDEQVFEAVVDHVAAALGAMSVGLWLLDESGTSAKLVRSVGYREAATRSLMSLSIADGARLPMLDAIRSKQPVWVSSKAELLERYPHLSGLTSPDREYRVACLPIVAQSGLFGGLGVTFEREREPHEDEREFLLLVAGYASQAIERLRLLERERRSRVRMGVLSQASRAFVETGLELQTRLHGVASIFGTMLSSAVGVSLIGDDNRLETSAVYHPDPEGQALLEELTRAHRINLGEGVSGAAIAAGKSIHVPVVDLPELMKRAAAPYRVFLERFPIYALSCVPLRASGRIIGVVLVGRVRKGETYSREDQELVEQLAERSAAAIDNSRLYEETFQARARSDQLYGFAQAVMKAGSVEQVLDAALDAIEEALGTRRAAVLTYGGEPLMRFRRWRNLSDQYRATVEGHSPWTPDTVAPQPVLVSDALGDPAWASYGALFAREGIGALGFIPLVSAGQLIGKFMVYFDRPRHLARNEVAMMQAIANHLAAVITRFEATAKLEETVRANELFAGVLAHDLRNPLGAMMNAAQLMELRREGLTIEERERKPLSRISSSGQRMMTMIEQLLDFTRARSGGGIEIAPEQTSLAHLCTEAIGELELNHPGAKVRSKVVGDQRGSWDPDRLLQVFSNLLANAAQHGVVEQGISLELDGTAADQVKIEIHNEGAIPAALLPHLFDPFRSTAHGRARSRGLGLGLFIVRELVRAHGGSVEVRSSEKEGTTFSIRLPRHSIRRTRTKEVPAS